MCGFFGLYRKNSGSKISLKEEEKKHLLVLLNHRGPDASQWHSDENIDLLCVRLRISGREKDSDMPFRSKSGRTLIGFNGEIYNYLDLASSYGIRVETRCDTEVMAEMLEEYGPHICNKFEGIFAACVYSINTGKLTLTRDPLGVKPLYYYQDSDVLIFCSELKPITYLLNTQSKAVAPDKNTAIQYLAFSKYDHGEATFIDRIKKLRPGHLIIQNGTEFISKKYYDYQYEQKNISLEKASAEFYQIFSNSIDSQTNTDLPINICLSGGNDSRLMLTGIKQCDKVENIENTWSYTYEDHEDHDIANVSNLTAHYGLSNNLITLEKQNVISMFDEVILALEQPFPGLPTLAKYNLYKQAKGRSSKIFLEGQGGDEIGGGYRYTIGAYIYAKIKYDRSFDLEKFVSNYAKVNKLEKAAVYKLIINSQAKVYGGNMSADGTNIIPSTAYNLLISKSVELNCSKDELFEANSSNEYQKILDDDIFMNKLQRILRSCDSCSMAFSKELRVPILAPSLVRFVRSLPPELKVNNGVHRAFFMDALKNNESSKIRSSMYSKRHVVDPQRQWLYSDLKDFARDSISSDRIEKYFELDSKIIESAINQFYDSETTPINSVFIWQLLCLSRWLCIFFD